MRPVETLVTVGRVKNFDVAVAENLAQGEIAFFPAPGKHGPGGKLPLSATDAGSFGFRGSVKRSGTIIFDPRRFFAASASIRNFVPIAMMRL